MVSRYSESNSHLLKHLTTKPIQYRAGTYIQRPNGNISGRVSQTEHPSHCMTTYAASLSLSLSLSLTLTHSLRLSIPAKNGHIYYTGQSNNRTHTHYHYLLFIVANSQCLLPVWIMRQQTYTFRVMPGHQLMTAYSWQGPFPIVSSNISAGKKFFG